MQALKIVGWSCLGGLLAGIVGFVIAIIASQLMASGGGDPATRGFGAGLFIEMLFLLGILAGLIAGGAYGIGRMRRSQPGE